MLSKDLRKEFCTGCIHALKLCPFSDQIVCEYCQMGAKMPSNFNILVVNKRYPNIENVIKFFRVDPHGIDYLQRRKLLDEYQAATKLVSNRSRFPREKVVVQQALF